MSGCTNQAHYHGGVGRILHDGECVACIRAERDALRASLTATQAKAANAAKVLNGLIDEAQNGWKAALEERDQALARAERAEGERDAFSSDCKNYLSHELDARRRAHELQAKLTEAEGLLREACDKGYLKDKVTGADGLEDRIDAALGRGAGEKS